MRRTVPVLAAAWVATAAGALAAESVLVKRAPGDGEWTPRQTATLDDYPGLAGRRADPASAYGGWKKKRFAATGFFRAEMKDGAWWLVDPKGYAFYSVGLNAVDPSIEPDAEEPTLRERFYGAFSSKQEWAGATRRWLVDHSFNTLGSWSDWRLVNATQSGKQPYTIQLHLLSGYARERREAAGAGAPTRMSILHVLDEGFAEYCARRMAELAPSVADDPYLLGYFSDNELFLRIGVLDRFLELAPDDPARRRVAEWLMQERNVDIDAADAAVTDEDRLAFYRFFIDAYFSTVAKAIRNADPNHLILASRFYWEDKYNRALFEAAAPHIDVVSFNLYDVWSPDADRLIEQWTQWSGRPVIITEWYAKGEDSGLSNKSGAGWLVRDQEARGKFYQNFALGLLAKPNVVGFHWFRYRDNNPDAARYFDSSNADSNKGVVDLDYKAYGPLAARARALNERVYSIREEFLERAQTP